MKKILLCFVAMTAMVACGNKQTAAPAEGDGARNVVAFEVARNYFFNQSSEEDLQGKNGQEILISPKITSEEEFNRLFGMATMMGKDGKPTEIDFSKQFVLAIVLSVTDYATEINPVKVEETGDTLFYTYEIIHGEKRTYSIQPISIIILDKKYADKEVVLSES